MALSKRKKPSILRKMVAESVTESDSVSEISFRGARTQEDIPSEVVTSAKTHKDVPNDVRTACDEAANVITRIATFDRKAKSILHGVYEEIDDILKSEHFFIEIKDEMTAEFGDLTKVIRLNQTDVYEELCPIVITGETSAGKSTFVNLMLGVELLPQSPLTCTSPICRISNRDHKTIVLTDSEDNQESMSFSKNHDAEEMRRLLKDYISVSKAGEKYKAVDICWPIPCLQNKIMIVDTPGISPDNDLLEHRLFEYLPSALAFIYVINPTNAGGIQSDRLQRILDEQDRRQLMGTRSVFDPRRAIFVCNKWDQIHEDEDEVFCHIRQKLQEKWTNFDSSKIYRISAREEMQRSKNGEPISQNFKSLLQGIDKMIPACLEEKIFRHANWQRYFLERLNFKINARITNASRTEDEKRIMAKNVLKRIEKVRGNLSTVQKRLIDEAKEQCLHISEKINKHLHLPATCDRMFTWPHEELPENDNMAAIENEIAAFVENKVKQEVKFWLQKTNNGGLSEFMTDKIQKECSIIETDCTEIDEMILGRSLDDCSLGISMRREINGTLDFSNISTGKKAAIIASLPLWAPFSVVLGLLALPFGLGYVFTKKVKNRKEVTDYRQRKTEYVKEVAYKMMENVTIQTISDKVLGYLLKEIEDEIKQFCTSTVPRRIRAGELLLKRILKDIREPIEVRRQCLLIDRDFKSAYGRVLFIYMEYFDMQKLKQSHMRKRDTPNSAEVFVNGAWIVTVVKERKWSYEKNADCSMLCDITILRNIQHKNILNFIAVTILPRQRGKLLQLHLEKCDNNLEIVIFHRSKEEEPWTNVRAYLCQILEGLAFLHVHGLIHRNIKSSNILIKDGIAKLSDIGIGSKRQLSGKNSSTDPQSLLYERESDIFRFGILLWESWYRRSALNCGSHSPLESYEELSNIIRDGWQPDFDGKIPSKIKLLIKTCWEKDPADRLNANRLSDRLQKENK